MHSTYAKRPAGELEFRFTIKNVGIIACGTTILLSWAAATNVGSTANLGPGASQAWVWNNAVDRPECPAGTIARMGESNMTG